MRTLIVSSYPPRHCGIGAYARDQAARLRADGDQVTVLSPPDGDGDLRAELVGGAAFRRAAAIGGRFDRIVVHFQPALYYAPRKPASKLLTSASLLWLVLRRRPGTEVMIHESDRPVRWRPDYALLRLALRTASRLGFHSDAERRAFERDYRMSLGRRGRVIPFATATAAAKGSVTPAEARRRLGVAVDAWPVLVCLGFVQPSKGFDRALEAFSRVFGSRVEAGPERSAPPAALYLVGSVRDGTSENRSYAARLRVRSGEVAGAHLVERWLSEEEFDLWLAAADRVVLPYRRSWSSGVLARAHELGTPAIVSDVGGLGEQAGTEDVVVEGEGDEGLVNAFEALRTGPRERAAT